MQHIRDALASSAATGADVNDLLRATNVLLRLFEGRLEAHAMLGPSPPEGSYRALASEFSAFHALSGALGELVMGLATSARDSLAESCSQLSVGASEGSSVHALRAACEQTLMALDTAMVTARTVSEESTRMREVLLETALRRDLPSKLRGEIELLINRIGEQSRGTPEAT